MNTVLRPLRVLLLMIPLLMSLQPVLGQQGKAVTMQASPPSPVPEVREALIIAQQAYSVKERVLTTVNGREREEVKLVPWGALSRPMMDGLALKKVLEAAGFNVVLVKDAADKEALTAAVKAFVDRVRDRNAVAYFYFTGHGIGLQEEEGPETYLLPVQLDRPTSEQHLADQSLELSRVLRKLRSAGSRLEIVVVDACRDNPYHDGIKLARKGGLPVSKGLPLARIPEKSTDLSPSSSPTASYGKGMASGTILFYAAQEGKTTNDDGLYAAAWVEILTTPGILLDVVPNRLASRVVASGGRMPDAQVRVVGEFYFLPLPEVPEPLVVTKQDTVNSIPRAESQPASSSVASVRPDRFNQLGGKWITISGGQFQRGSNSGARDEQPVGQVRVATFAMSQAEVTVAQYRACVVADACNLPGTGIGCNWNAKDHENHPINCVSWNDAQKFVQWLGGGARLPTEAEWNYAASATGRDLGRERRYPWGDTPEPTCDVAVMNGCGMGTQLGCSRAAGNTAEGLCDMGGNVWEWVEDCYHGNYEGAPWDGSARTSGCSAPSSRVVRGGGWVSDGDGLRAADRDRSDVGYRDDDVGFRVVRSVSRAGVP